MKTKKPNRILLVPIVIAFIIIIIGAIFLKFLTPFRNKSINLDHRPGGDIYTNSQLTPSISPNNEKRIVDAFPNQNILWYQVRLRTDNLSGGVNQNPPLLVPDVLPELFDLPMVKQSGGVANVIEKLVYNTQTGYPYQDAYKDGVLYRQYNSDFFIAIKGFSLDLTKHYKNNHADATLSFVDPKIIPYIKNKDYCETNSDCFIRDSFCGYGSFNKYEEYADIYGCESPPYDLESVNAEGTPTFMDDQYDETMKCNVKAHYAGAACISHHCKGTGRTLSCVNN